MTATVLKRPPEPDTVTVLITHVSSPELFAGSDDDPRQLLRVELTRARSDGALSVRVSGDGLSGTADLPPGDGPVRVEVPLEIAEPLRSAYGATVPATVIVSAEGRDVASDSGTVVIAEPQLAIRNRAEMLPDAIGPEV